MRLHIVLPELLWPEPEDGLAFQGLATPALEWLLARGTLSRNPRLTAEAALAAAFGLAGDVAFGALRLRGESESAVDGGLQESSWLCADPVHLRFHQERIILADAGAFDLTGEEAEALVAGLNKDFADLGRFHVCETRRWYLQCVDEYRFHTPPLSAVAGRKVDGVLGDDPKAGQMRNWLNEIQMFLHAHPVNEDRASRGNPTINSLWLWGGGSLPEKIEADYDGVWAGNPLSRGLARAAGILDHRLPEGLATILDHAAPGTSHLIVLDQLQAPVLYENSGEWRENLCRLESGWFEPLRAALGRRIDEATLVAPTVYGHLTWRITGADRWKVWRKPHPLPGLAKELAR